MYYRTTERSNYAIKGIPRCIDNTRFNADITYWKKYGISSRKGKYHTIS